MPSRPPPRGKRSPVVRISEATGGGKVMSTRNLALFTWSRFFGTRTPGSRASHTRRPRATFRWRPQKYGGDNAVGRLVTTRLVVWITVEKYGESGAGNGIRTRDP